MRRIQVPFVVAALLAGSIVARPRVCAEGSAFPPSFPAQPRSCGERYNSLISRAQAFLVEDDRARALDSLLAARNQLRRCEELEKRNSGPVAIALN